MNKKGFTLAEVLGVITILAILGLLVFPVIDKTIKDAKEDGYKIQVKSIETSAKNWITGNAFNMLDRTGEDMLVTLYQLKQEGAVDKNVQNPLNKKLFADDIIIRIVRTASDYEAVLQTNTGTNTYLEEYSQYTPTLKLNGSPVTYLEFEKNSTRTYALSNDPGVTALSSTGANISSSVGSAILNSSGTEISSISYGQIGRYNIGYEVTSNDITVKVMRTVIVRDTKPPVITVPATTTVSSSSAASYDLYTGVTITDQSTFTKNKDRANLPSTPGKYTITYTATDSFGNTSTARRTITVQ